MWAPYNSMWSYLLISLILSVTTAVETITATNNAILLGQSALGTTSTGLPLILVNATYLGGSTASGSFINGPLSFGNGAILTTGAATAALPTSPDPVPGVNNGAAGSTLCTITLGAVSTFNAAVLDMFINLPIGWQGISGSFIFASAEYPQFVGSQFNDRMVIFIDGIQVALDGTGSPITINGGFFSGPTVVTPPASGSSYGGSTPILNFAHALQPGNHHIQVAICDVGDASYDSGVFVRFDPCAGTCNSPVGIGMAPVATPSIATTTIVAAVAATTTTATDLSMVTITTFIPSDSIAYTSTIPQSGTVPAEVIIGYPSSTITFTAMIPSISPAFTSTISQYGSIPAQVVIGEPIVAGDQMTCGCY